MRKQPVTDEITVTSTPCFGNPELAPREASPETAPSVDQIAKIHRAEQDLFRAGP